MDFAGKIRAGRAFLNWTQDDLAEKSDLSLQGIQKVERGDVESTARTQKKIIHAFEKSGVIFTDKGIEYVENPVFFVEGDTHESCYMKLLQDAEEHLRQVKNPELLIMYANDQVSPKSVNDFYRQMRKQGIKMRQLIEQGNTYILGPLEEYRYIPKGYFINRVSLVYGDRIATETSNFNRALIRIDPLNAAIQRNTFNILWSLLEQPLVTTSEERF